VCFSEANQNCVRQNIHNIPRTSLGKKVCTAELKYRLSYERRNGTLHRSATTLHMSGATQAEQIFSNKHALRATGHDFSTNKLNGISAGSLSNHDWDI
jgi:hypothetical protein